MLVHCRTGSLEKTLVCLLLNILVHCRTGSLEMDSCRFILMENVHCRTGSLEIEANICYIDQYVPLVY